MLAGKGRKILCMDSLGELVRTWRLASGLKPADLARRIGGTVKRQHIEQLENAGSRTPRYIAELAKAMGTTVDDLLALRMPPPLSSPETVPTAQLSRERNYSAGPPPAKPPRGFKSALRMTTQREVELLDALDMLLEDDRESTIRGIFERAEKQRAHLQRLLPVLSKKPESLDE